MSNPSDIGLDESSIDRDPFRQFHLWLEEARAAKLHEPHAMTAATVGADGRPSARMVLLRGFDERGFTFYTNYDSRKGRELEANAWVALVCYWAELERQVRIEGQAVQVSAEESDAYFNSRPRGSRLAAWVSHQSEIVADREELEAGMGELQMRYPNETVPRPPHWGGYRVVPVSIEFWQGRPNRLHDRLRFDRTPDGWKLSRLAP